MNICLFCLSLNTPNALASFLIDKLATYLIRMTGGTRLLCGLGCSPTSRNICTKVRDVKKHKVQQHKHKILQVKYITSSKNT